MCMDAAARGPGAEPPLGLMAPNSCAPLEPQAHRSCSNECCPIVCSGSLTLCFEAPGEAAARPRATQYGGEERGGMLELVGNTTVFVSFLCLFFFFLLFLFGTRSCLPNGKSPPPWKELISERLKRFTLPFQITVKCSNASPQERLSLGFFPDALGWNFPPDSTGKKSASAKNKASPRSSKAGMDLPCGDWGTTAPHGPPAQEAVRAPHPFAGIRMGMCIPQGKVGGCSVV